MVKREDILYLDYLKKAEYTGSTEGMRYRLERVSDGEETKLLATVWPEPFNDLKTPEDKKRREKFEFSEDGITDAVAWMNDRLFESDFAGSTKLAQPF